MNKSLELCAREQNFLKDCSLLQCGKMGVLQVFAIWKQKDDKGHCSGWDPRSCSWHWDVPTNPPGKNKAETFLLEGLSRLVQWLRIHFSDSGDMGLIPGQGVKIP